MAVNGSVNTAIVVKIVGAILLGVVGLISWNLLQTIENSKNIVALDTTVRTMISERADVLSKLNQEDVSLHVLIDKNQEILQKLIEEAERLQQQRGR